MRASTRFCVLLVAATAAFQTCADVYRWVDKDGVVHYADKPQSPGDKPVDLPSLQTYKPGSAPPVQSLPSTTAAPKAATGGSVSIVAPADQETLRDAERNVSVTVEATLGDGDGLVYYLDGAAQNRTPTPSTAYLIPGVERGQHSLAVALVGRDGKESARSTTLTIFMMPPMARH